MRAATARRRTETVSRGRHDHSNTRQNGVTLSNQIIYGLAAADGAIRYVGLTSTGRDRLYRHRYDAKRGLDTPLYRWMRKHGAASIEMVTLEVVQGSLELLDEREIHWIKSLRDQGAALLNLTAGGRLTPGYKHSAMTRAKMSVNTNRRRGKEHPNFGKHLAVETRVKLGVSKIGNRNAAKISSTDRTIILEALASRSATQVALARRFAVTQANISLIKKAVAA